MRILKIFFVLNFTLLLLIVSEVKGQKYGKIDIQDKWFLSLHGGFTMEWGDVESNWKGHFRAKPAFEVMLGKEINALVEIRTGILSGSVEGYQPSRDRYFNADIFEYNISAVVDLSTLTYGFNSDRKVEVHGIAGLGFYNYNSILRNISNDSVLASTGYNNYFQKTSNQTEMIFKYGINLRFLISDHINLTLENTWSTTGSDLLDGFRGGFIYDIYSLTSFGVTYRFNLRKYARPLFEYNVRTGEKN